MKLQVQLFLFYIPILKFIDPLLFSIKLKICYYTPQEISRKPETVIRWKIVAINRNNDTNCSFIRRLSCNGV